MWELGRLYGEGLFCRNYLVEEIFVSKVISTITSACAVKNVIAIILGLPCPRKVHYLRSPTHIVRITLQIAESKPSWDKPGLQQVFTKLTVTTLERSFVHVLLIIVVSCPW